MTLKKTLRSAMKAKVGAADRESRQIMETTEAHSMVKPMFFNESCSMKS